MDQLNMLEKIYFALTIKFSYLNKYDGHIQLQLKINEQLLSNLYAGDVPQNVGIYLLKITWLSKY